MLELVKMWMFMRRSIRTLPTVQATVQACKPYNEGRGNYRRLPKDTEGCRRIPKDTESYRRLPKAGL